MAASKVKVAAVFLDLESSLQKARALIEQAAAEGGCPASRGTWVTVRG
jgi:hypothetical protein